jgi:hypothetical protein
LEDASNFSGITASLSMAVAVAQKITNQPPRYFYFTGLKRLLGDAFWLLGVVT